ncbi:MAG: PIN domain-containing protein [Planctomycetaceae bacterium]|jgi:predicted nucleic acid-binding protein|nr:PIN domain-containing protein [Planctomycetaceae bacterium]
MITKIQVTKMTRIYLDNCCYNRPFDDQTQIKVAAETKAKLRIQQLIMDRTLELVVSFISRYENNKNPNLSNRNSIDEFFNYAVEYIDNEQSGNIKQRTFEIMKYGIKVKDALHLACAIEAQCNYFVTTDSDFQKYRSVDIVICNPVGFLRILE